MFGRFRRFRSDRDLQEELRSHIEQQTADNIAAGMSEAEARRRARLSLGSPQAVVERTRDFELATVLESCYRDLVSGLRALWKSPLFFLTTTLTLALGIGANTAIFTLLYGLLLRSLPVADPSAVALIHIVDSTDSRNMAGLTWPMIKHLRERQRSFTDISAWDFASVTMKDREGTVRMYDATLVSGNGFWLLGVKPYLGRLIDPSDDVRGGPDEGWPIVLSYGTWNDVFRGDPQIVGKRLTVSNVPVTVAGVTPPEFEGIQPGTKPKVYLPLQFATLLAGRDILNLPQSTNFIWPIARLKPEATLEQANAEISAYRKSLFDTFLPREILESPEARRARVQVSPGRSGLPFMARTYRQPLLLMQGLVGVVLLLCCLNVGGLMMSKFYARRNEFAVRTAIGAGRWRLMRQYLTESCVTAAAGAALGGAGAWYGTGALLSFFINPNDQEGLSVRPDTMVFGISAAFAILATLLFGTLPAWRASRCDPGSLLKTRGALGARRQIAGRAFVPVQVALSLVLVATAALLSQSLIRIRGQYAGFDVNHITLTCPQFANLPLKPEAILNLYHSMVDRLERAPDIQAAAFTWFTPMTNSLAASSFDAAVGGAHPPKDPKMAFNYVGPGYFRTMQTRIVASREFERREHDLSVCVLNQAAAEFLFPRQEAIGQYVRGTNRQVFENGVSCRVVGVAENAKYASLRDPAPRTIYFPMTEWRVQTGNMVFLMRSKTEAQAIAAYRAALAENAPQTPLLRFATLRQQRDDSMGAQRLLTVLSNVFGGLALFLSAIGLYGLLASSVAQRTGEIGVRMALGAQRGRVLGMILGEAMRLFAVGLALGLLGLWGVLRFVESMLFGVGAFDPATLAGAAALLAAVALAAALIPAQRGASVDPMQALRTE